MLKRTHAWRLQIDKRPIFAPVRLAMIIFSLRAFFINAYFAPATPGTRKALWREHTILRHGFLVAAPWRRGSLCFTCCYLKIHCTPKRHSCVAVAVALIVQLDTSATCRITTTSCSKFCVSPKQKQSASLTLGAALIEFAQKATAKKKKKHCIGSSFCGCGSGRSSLSAPSCSP